MNHKFQKRGGVWKKTEWSKPELALRFGWEVKQGACKKELLKVEGGTGFSQSSWPGSCRSLVASGAMFM